MLRRTGANGEIEKFFAPAGKFSQINLLVSILKMPAMCLRVAIRPFGMDRVCVAERLH